MRHAIRFAYALAALVAAPCTLACVPISAVPVTISAAGTYCVTGDLVFGGTGYAIDVAADDVTIDFGGYSLTGPGSGTGVFSSARKHVQVRNGRLLRLGTAVSAVNPLHFTVEDLQISRVTYGIAIVNGSYIAVQRNRIFDATSIGIVLSGVGPGVTPDYVATIVDNELAAIGGSYSASTEVTTGIRVENPAAIIRGNRIAGVRGAPGSAPILAGGGSLLVENLTIAAALGPQCVAGSPSEKSVRNATAMGAANSFLNCLKLDNY